MASCLLKPNGENYVWYLYWRQMKRGSFTIDDLNEIAEVVGVEFKRNFILTNGEEI